MGKYYDPMVNYKTLVLGASSNPERYSYKVVLSLLRSGIEVVPMGNKKGIIGNLSIVMPFKSLTNIHTVSIYLAPLRQEEYFEYIMSLQPKRVLFNPGSENIIFTQRLNERKILWENACNLVLLSTNQYQS
jgi:predicted CoA-binding protein